MTDVQEKPLIITLAHDGEILLVWKVGDEKGLVGKIRESRDGKFLVEVEASSVRSYPAPGTAGLAKTASLSTVDLLACLRRLVDEHAQQRA